MALGMKFRNISIGLTTAQSMAHISTYDIFLAIEPPNYNPTSIKLSIAIFPLPIPLPLMFAISCKEMQKVDPR